MLIPNKFNGFHGGVRRCFGGGGGGGGGDGAGDGTGDSSGGSAPGGDAGGGPNNVYTPPTNMTNTNVNTNRGSVTGMNFTGGNTGGYSGPGVNTTQGMATLSAMKGTPWEKSGSAYNELLNQGFTSNQIRNSASSMYGAPSDSNWSGMVQNAGMTSPTGRPMAGSDQFFQPVYNSSYTNYARPATQFDTSTYGTQPVYSPARAWNDANSGSAAGGKQAVNNAVNSYIRDNPNSDINSTLAAMRASGVNRTDVQAAGGYNNYGPQMSMPSMQTQAQQPFNPFSNTSGYGGGLPMTAGYGGFGSRVGGLSPYVTGQTPQIQSPFSFQQQSFQQPSYQPQTPFSFQQQSYQQPQLQQYNPYQTQTPFSYQPSYQQQSYQQPQQYNPYQQYEQSLGSYNPYQMQSPFSYQQPSSGGYSSYGRGNFIPDAPLSEGMMGTMGGTGYDPVTGRMDLGTAGGSGQYTPAPARSSGPTTPIVGRSSGFRGTPNVMRRAEGGIASLMDDVE